MASQGAASGQGPYRDLRRTVDRVDERYDERSRVRPASGPGVCSRAPDGLIGVARLFGRAFRFVPIYA